MRPIRALALALTFVLAPLTASATGGPLVLEIDATDIPRRLIHATVTMPAEPGPMSAYYVEWTPGNHNPSGPIQNVVNIEVRDAGGDPIRWTRDPAQVVRIDFDVPENSPSVEIAFSYITNQPSVNSRSTDSYGFPNFGGISFNTVAWYPGGVGKDETEVDASLRLPAGWDIATSLPIRMKRDGYVNFEPVSLAYLVDSPAIFGEHLRRWELRHPEAPHWICAVADSPDLLELDPAQIERFNEMIVQSEKIFGDFPYRSFRFLVYVSGDVPGIGLEHTESTYIAMGAKAFVNTTKPDPPSMGVVPHEYVHVWNGKLRAPEGLLARDYHTPAQTQLLWVYEGLTSYLDDVIMVRCGLMTEAEYKDGLATRIDRYQHQPGRLWRSVEDTARGQRHLRARSDSWAELRRRQDYYSEGALFWMAADAVIRRGTNGQRSLEDFTRAFFDVELPAWGSPATYTRRDVVDGLRAVYSGHDWDAMIRDLIEEPRETLRIGLPERLGYRFVYADEPTEEQEKDLKPPHARLTARTLGLSADEAGVVNRVIFGSPADEAKMAYDMKIVAVGGETFTPERLKNAIERTPETGGVDLLVEWGDSVQERRIAYDGGLRFPRLERIEGEPDLIAEIAAPR